ncbi:MAG: GHKL domain-containing protein [Clostridia bacterium]|nr:GHKL domain-containing protein [Clostridia bacterium]
MIEGLGIYFQNIADFAHCFQILGICLAIVLSFTTFDNTVKEWAIALFKVGCLFVFVLLLESVCFSLMRSINGALVGLSFPTAYFIGMVLYAVFFSKLQGRVRVILSGVMFSATVSVTELVKNFCFLPNGGGSFVALSVVIVNCINYGLAFVLHYLNIDKFKQMPEASVVLTVLGGIVIAASIFWFTVISNFGMTSDMRDKINLLTGSAGIIMVVLIVTIYLLLYFVCEKNEEAQRFRFQKQMAEMDAYMLTITQNALEEIKKFRHDQKNRIAYIVTMLENEQYEDVKKYLKSEGGERLKPFYVVDCNNKTLNAILNMEKAKADAKNIHFNLNVDIPSELPYSDVDLCSLFSNLIDNALEACERDKMENPYVDITIKVNGNYLCIYVENPIGKERDPNEIKHLVTSKKDKLVHGYGTKIIKGIAEKYSGHVVFSVEKTTFIAEVMLDLG